MAEGLCLDTGALLSVERGDRRVLRLLELVREVGGAIDVPTGVLAQAWRGGARQAMLARFLRTGGVTFVELDVPAARAVGELCAMTGASDIVDGHVALHAHRRNLTIVTSDEADMRELAPDLAVIAV